MSEVSIWMALSDPKRRHIVNLLEEKPRTTSELSQYFDVSRFAIMKHLKVLEQANLISVRREGRSRWNILNDDLVRFLRTNLADDDGPHNLADILGLFPGRWPAQTGAEETACIEQSLLLEAAPSTVFEALTVDIDRWWDPRASSESQIRLEPYVNGRFFEAFNGSGQGILYATITYIKQDEELRLRGTPEILRQIEQTSIADNYLRFVLQPQDNCTLLCLSHTVTCSGDEMTRIDVDSHWRVLLEQRLKPFVEKGISPTSTIPDKSETS
jgi:DNA-binding transcriptional ArsR family regulator